MLDDIGLLARARARTWSGAVADQHVANHCTMILLSLAAAARSLARIPPYSLVPSFHAHAGTRNVRALTEFGGSADRFGCWIVPTCSFQQAKSTLNVDGKMERTKQSPSRAKSSHQNGCC